jgi:hypothetical protein
VTLNCEGDDIQIGDQSFCQVSQDQAKNDLNLGSAAGPIWVLKP